MARTATRTTEQKTTSQTSKKKAVFTPPPVAFGESLGMDVPTRYTAQTHDTINMLLAGDTLMTPMLFGMSTRTVWFCRALAGILFIGRGGSSPNGDAFSLRNRLEMEAIVGLLLLALAVRGAVSNRVFDRVYLFVSGVVMIANSLMTELDQPADR